MTLSPLGQLSFHFTIREFGGFISSCMWLRKCFCPVIFSRARKLWRKRLLGQVVVNVKVRVKKSALSIGQQICTWMHVYCNPDKWPSNLMYILDAGTLLFYQKRMAVAQNTTSCAKFLHALKKTTRMPAQMHWPTCKDSDHELKRTRVIPLLETAENQAHQRNIQVYRYTRGHSVEVRVFFSKIQWLIQTTV